MAMDRDCQYQSVPSLQNHREWLQEGSLLLPSLIEGCRTNRTVASNSRGNVHDHKPPLAPETKAGPQGRTCSLVYLSPFVAAGVAAIQLRLPGTLLPG